MVVDRGALEAIQEQVLQTKAKLQQSEEELVAYAKDAGITVTGAERSLIDANIEAINAGLSAAVQERLDYGRLVQQIDAGRGASLGPVLESKGLESLRGQLAQLEGEYQQKLGLLKPGFPEMQALSARFWGSGFLPSEHQGCKVRAAADAVLYLRNPDGVSRADRRRMLDMVAAIGERELAASLDPEVRARITQAEMAYRMQMSVPELTDFSDESPETVAAPTRRARRAPSSRSAVRARCCCRRTGSRPGSSAS